MNWSDFTGNRKIAFIALTGSHNYNLNTANSDRDYKAFVFPSFSDLYSGNMFAKSVTSDELDATVHDVRKLPELWWKANINFIEVLYSIDHRMVDPDFRPILQRKDEFATMNMPYLYNATFGMYMAKIHNLHKGTETTKSMVEKIGYDAKEASHAIRCLSFLQRYFAGKSIEDALWYDTNDPMRETLLSIKRGELLEAEVLEMSDKMRVETETLKDWYLNIPSPDYLKTELDEMIKEMIRERL